MHLWEKGIIAMKLKLRISDILIVVDVVLAFLMYEIRNNAYLILSIALIAFIINNKVKLNKKILFNPIIAFSLCFVIFGVISSKWAANSSFSIIASLTAFIWILWFIILAHIYYGRIEVLLRIYTIAIDIIAVYTISYYGVFNLINSAIFVSRINNGFNNINVLGFLFAINFLISYTDILFNKDNKKWIRAIFMLLMVLAMSSRKAIFIVIIGGGILTYLELKNEKKGKGIIKAILIIIVTAIALFVMRNTSIMQAIIERISGVLGIFKFTGFSVDGSTWLREKYIAIGMEVFSDNKILGIGLDNSRLYLQIMASHDTYLHNNFVELLCDTGLVGFCLYYLPRVIMIIVIWAKRKYWITVDGLAFSIAVILLISDYGWVSYNERATWLFMIPIFFSYSQLKDIREIRTKSG